MNTCVLYIKCDFIHINVSEYIKHAHILLYTYMKTSIFEYPLYTTDKNTVTYIKHPHAVHTSTWSQVFPDTCFVPTRRRAPGAHTPVEEVERKAPFPSARDALDLMGTGWRGDPGQGCCKV